MHFFCNWFSVPWLRSTSAGLNASKPSTEPKAPAITSPSASSDSSLEGVLPLLIDNNRSPCLSSFRPAAKRQRQLSTAAPAGLLMKSSKTAYELVGEHAHGAAPEVPHCVNPGQQHWRPSPALRPLTRLAGSYTGTYGSASSSPVAHQEHIPKTRGEWPALQFGGADAFERSLPNRSSNSSQPLAAAFMNNLQESSLLTSALTLIEERDIHPVGAGKFHCTEYTLAGMYGLVKRAQLTHEELDEEVLLTLLWMLEAWSSQYRGFLDDVLEDYLSLDPWLCNSSKEAKLALQRRMARIQLQVLKRCDWRMGLDDTQDLWPALAVLSRHPDFHSYCLLVECEACRVQSTPPSSLQGMELDSVAEGAGSMGTAAAASHAPHAMGRKRQREDSPTHVQPAEP